MAQRMGESVAIVDCAFV